MLGLIYGAADELIQAPTAWEKQKRQREAGVKGKTQ
jgi:hypothetical protein